MIYVNNVTTLMWMSIILAGCIPHCMLTSRNLGGSHIRSDGVKIINISLAFPMNVLLVPELKSKNTLFKSLRGFRLESY